MVTLLLLTTQFYYAELQMDRHFVGSIHKDLYE